MFYKVHLKLNTPVGIFTGFVSGELPSFEEAVSERDHVQEQLKDLNLGVFTFFSDVQLGTEITLTHNMIVSSVFEFTIMDFE